jgi:hypothetical protein
MGAEMGGVHPTILGIVFNCYLKENMHSKKL